MTYDSALKQVQADPGLFMWRRHWPIDIAVHQHDGSLHYFKPLEAGKMAFIPNEGEKAAADWSTGPMRRAV